MGSDFQSTLYSAHGSCSALAWGLWGQFPFFLLLATIFTRGKYPSFSRAGYERSVLSSSQKRRPPAQRRQTVTSGELHLGHPR